MAKTNSKFDYQQQSAELELIISKLQSEQTSIDEALKLYEQANKLVSDLTNYLKTAENRLSKINVTKGQDR